MPRGAESIVLLEDNNPAPLSSAKPWGKSVGPSRRSYVVVACLCSLSFLTIVDRVCISAAKTPMAAELYLTDTTFGWVFGAFTVGYTLMMVPSGWLADRFGPRKMLASIVLLWSVLTAATGLVRGAAILLLVRFLFGLAEAGAFPGAARAISNWLPTQERGLALGLLNTGSRLGRLLLDCRRCRFASLASAGGSVSCCLGSRVLCGQSSGSGGSVTGLIQFLAGT